MRKIKRTPLSEYFSHPVLDEVNRFSHYPVYLAKKYLLNKVVLLAVLTLISLMLGIFDRHLLVIGVSNLILLGLLYLEAKGLAQGIFVERKPMAMTYTEFDQVLCQFELINSGSFSLRHCQIEDHFGPALESRWQSALAEPLPAKTRTLIQYDRTCNGGMGEFQVGPIEVRVRDSLGVFEFRVTFDNLIEIEVLPKVESISELPLRGYPESDQYGLYDVASKGNSVNFVGIRHYQHGDSLRHIAWKITAKRQQLVVKEFERSMNSFVSVFLNLDGKIHLGTQSLSTWELARDATLSIVQQQLELGNTVQFFSNQIFCEPGRGEFYLEYLAKQIMKLSIAPPEDSQGQETTNNYILNKYSEWISPGSTLFFITPFQTKEIEQSVHRLRYFQAQNVQVFCVFIDISSLFNEMKTRLSWLQMPRDLLINEAHPIDQVIYDLKLNGIESFVIKQGTPMRQSFSNRSAAK